MLVHVLALKPVPTLRSFLRTFWSETWRWISSWRICLTRLSM